MPLLAGDDYEAWLLGWPVGNGIELHDHGDSWGAAFVVQGAINETFLDGSGALPAGRHLRHRRLPAGSLVAFGPDHIHDMSNAGDRPALSIHVYSPRLTTMTYYENIPERGLAAIRTEECR